MKQLVLAGALMGVLSVGTAYAQEKGAKPDSGAQGHTAPKTQPTTAPDNAVISEVAR